MTGLPIPTQTGDQVRPLAEEDEKNKLPKVGEKKIGRKP